MHSSLPSARRRSGHRCCPATRSWKRRISRSWNRESPRLRSLLYCCSHSSGILPGLQPPDGIVWCRPLLPKRPGCCRRIRTLCVHIRLRNPATLRLRVQRTSDGGSGAGSLCQFQELAGGAVIGPCSSLVRTLQLLDRRRKPPGTFFRGFSVADCCFSSLHVELNVGS